MKNITYIPPVPDTSGRKARHVAALRNWPSAEGTVATAIRAWCDYATYHHRRYGSPIGEDYVLGPAWRDWGLALRTLLNGELGGLDAGTLDTILADNLAEQGFPIK